MTIKHISEAYRNMLGEEKQLAENKEHTRITVPFSQYSDAYEIMDSIKLPKSCRLIAVNSNFGNGPVYNETLMVTIVGPFDDLEEWFFNTFPELPSDSFEDYITG